MPLEKPRVDIQSASRHEYEQESFSGCIDNRAEQVHVLVSSLYYVKCTLSHIRAPSHETLLFDIVEKCLPTRHPAGKPRRRALGLGRRACDHMRVWVGVKVKW